MSAAPAARSSRALSGVGLLLTPGAGADRNQPALVAVDHAVSASGGTVRRMDFPYRKAGRRAPDRAPVLIASVVEEAGPLAEQVGRLYLGGRSMGGRMCSMAVAEGLPAAGLVLVSYPLHPPGRPDRLRTGHFGALRVPCLFISGTRDAFGTVAELEEAVTAIPGPASIRWLPGDHSLRGRDEEVAGIVAGWLAELASPAPAPAPPAGPAVANRTPEPARPRRRGRAG